MATALERHAKGGQSRPKGALGGMGRDRPARGARIGDLRAAAAQKKRAHARTFRRQHEPSQRHKIDRFGRSPRLDQHRAERLAMKPFFRGL